EPECGAHRVARVLELNSRRNDLNSFIDRNNNNLPDSLLFYYLGNDNEKIDDFLKGNGKIHLLSFVDSGESLIDKIFPDNRLLISFRTLFMNMRRMKKMAGRELKDVGVAERYICNNIFSSIAAQKLLEIYPDLKFFADRIRSLADLQKAIVYSKSAEKNPEIVERARYLEEVTGKFPAVTIDNLKALFKEYAEFFKFSSQLGAARISKEESKRFLDSLFYRRKSYECVACLTELVDNPQKLASAFDKTAIFAEFESDKLPSGKTIKPGELARRIQEEFYGPEEETYRKVDVKEIKVGVEYYVDEKSNTLPGEKIVVQGRCNACPDYIFKFPGGLDGQHLGKLKNHLFIKKEDFVPVSMNLTEHGYRNFLLDLELEQDEQTYEKFRLARTRAEDDAKFEPLLKTGVELNLIQTRLRSIWKD
ncbi:MAG: hypothetical protein AABY22_13925, partial [Nanoarchaeota archaeon]